MSLTKSTIDEAVDEKRIVTKKPIQNKKSSTNKKLVSNKKSVKKNSNRSGHLKPYVFVIQILANQMLRFEEYANRYMTLRMNCTIEQARERLMGSLVISNHDIFVFDFVLLPFVFYKWGIRSSVVVNENFIKASGTIFDKLTDKFGTKLIPTRDSFQTIVQDIKDGRTVLILYDPIEYPKIEKKRSIPGIMNETNCKAVFLRYDYMSEKIRKREKYRSSEYVLHNTRSLWSLIRNRNASKPMLIDIRIDRPQDSYEEFIKRKQFIKPVYFV